MMLGSFSFTVLKKSSNLQWYLSDISPIMRFRTKHILHARNGLGPRLGQRWAGEDQCGTVLPATIGYFEVQILGMWGYVGHTCIFLLRNKRIIPMVKSYQADRSSAKNIHCIMQCIWPLCQIYHFWPSCHNMQEFFSSSVCYFLNGSFRHAILEMGIYSTVGESLLPLVVYWMMDALW